MGSLVHDYADGHEGAIMADERWRHPGKASIARVGSVAILSLWCSTSCTSDPEQGEVYGSVGEVDTGEAEDQPAGPEPTSTSTTSGTADSSESEVSGTGPKFDVMSQADLSSDENEGCDKVDFLFVVDNSSSMADEQANLISNFPAFIEGIQGTLEEVDSLHLGITTTDDYVFNIQGCQSLGSLVVRTGGVDSSQQTCGPYASGLNYISEVDPVPEAFSCAAQVGVEGSNEELPVQALLNVIEQKDAAAGQCNEGFLRDDSLLVVVLLTDEADGPNDAGTPVTPGTPIQWFDRVVEARGGIESNVVLLSLVLFEGGPCPVPAPLGQDAQDIIEFTEMFTHGQHGGICQDFGPYFQEAVGVVSNACDAFTPVG